MKISNNCSKEKNTIYCRAHLAGLIKPDFCRERRVNYIFTNFVSNAHSFKNIEQFSFRCFIVTNLYNLLKNMVILTTKFYHKPFASIPHRIIFISIKKMEEAGQLKKNLVVVIQIIFKPLILSPCIHFAPRILILQ